MPPAAAALAQRRLAAHPWPEGRAIRVRMGLHLGAPDRTADGYAGLDVHRAARICAAGHGGQVLLSEVFAAAVRPVLPDGVAPRALGEVQLKDLPEPEQLVQLVIAGLPAEFPPLQAGATRSLTNLSQPALPRNSFLPKISSDCPERRVANPHPPHRCTLEWLQGAV